MYTIKELQKIISEELPRRSEKILKKSPVNLYEPINYSLEMGGKRLRPILLLLAYNIFSEDIEKALPAALAIEVFHNFTLLHDDIMDNADVRRNHATVHKAYSENSAILSGDAMAFLGYKYLVECELPHLIETISLFTNTAIQVCEGQQYDMDFENRLDVTEEEYLNMIQLKTAVLLACSLKVGALLADAPTHIANQLYEFGINLGLSFQLQDDFLDTFGEQATFGKKIGGDILANKKTFLLINALENASEEQRKSLLHWIKKENYNPEEKILAVTKIYKKVGVENTIKNKVDFYFNNALGILKNMQLDDAQKQPLMQLADKMLKRKS